MPSPPRSRRSAGQNHRNYVWTYVALHGESYFANQSFNGLLQRAFFNGENLTWREDTYPPFSPGVYGGTLLAALALIGCCLFWPPRASQRASTTDLMIAILTCVLPSPVAWEHHYGILLPMYALLFPILCRRPVFGRTTLPWLAASYLLTSNYFGAAQRLAGTRANPAGAPAQVRDVRAPTAGGRAPVRGRARAGGRRHRTRHL